MKNIFTTVYAFLVIIFAAGISIAGDFATLNVIGFSPSGRYMAFEEYGTQDGSGFPYANTFFIDVSKNAFAAAPVKTVVNDDSASESAARKRAMALSAKKLKQFGIVIGNTGRLVLSHLITDKTLDTNEGEGGSNVVRFYDQYGSFYHKGDYELTLNAVKVSEKKCSDYTEQGTYMFEIKLTNKDDNSNKFLQKDTSLPESRGCPLSYRLQNVYLYKGSIAVFVNVFTQGFEGPDMRYLAVTGKLKED